jgi:hypothetical protein
MINQAPGHEKRIPRARGGRSDRQSQPHRASTEGTQINDMKTPVRILVKGLPLVLLPLSIGGCVTPALWQDTARREWKPNPPDRVMLIAETNHQHAVVVLFRQSEQLGKTSQCRKVGWRVSPSLGELALTPRTIARLTNSCGEVQSVPLFQAENVPETASSIPPGYAVWSGTNQQLTVHIEGIPPGPFALPDSHERARIALRVLALPFALAADAVCGLGAVLVSGGAMPAAGAGP